MRIRRLALTAAVIGAALAASLLLVTALASAQRTPAPFPADTQGRIDGQPVAKLLSAPAISVTFPSGDWPWYAQGEISVHPDPPVSGRPIELCARVVNHDPDPHTVRLEFSVASFGVGVPFHLVGTTEVIVPPNEGPAVGCVAWVPREPGPWCVQAEIRDGQNEPSIDRNTISQRNIDIWEPLVPGEEDVFSFQVGPFPNRTTINLVPKNIRSDWTVLVEPPELNLEANEPGEADLIVTPPGGISLGSREVIVDVEGYVGEELIGGFRKLDWPPVPLHRPRDPFYAESEISVSPYPPLAGEPTEICVELRNLTPVTQTVTAHFLWANFGIGLPFHPINGPQSITLPPHAVVRKCITWIPPVSGHICIKVELDIGGYHRQWSQRNMDVDEPLEPDVPHPRPFLVGNPTPEEATITLGLVPHLDDWGLALSEDILINVGPDERRIVTLTVTPPAGRPLPPDEHPIVDVEAFIEGELIGGFRKIFRPPVPIHRPEDPIYAESEIFVHPYPPRAREPTEVGVEIRNPTDAPQTVTVTFKYANFGIGLPFHPINGPITVTVPDHGMVRPIIMWLPPHEGLWCIQVDIELPGHEEPFYSQRNIDVGEPLEPNTPHSRPFPVRNPTEEVASITLGLVPHFPDWGLALSEDVLTNVGPGETRIVTLTVTPPADLPGDGDPIVDVEAYIDGVLIGGFRKIFRPPVPIHRPKDPIYAESEIGVDPYPVIPGQPTELSVEVFNPTDEDRIVTATFSVAPFGIGLPFLTAHIAPNPILIFVPAHGAARGHVMWQPPGWDGKFCVKVTLEMEGHEPIWSQRNIDVGEPLEPGMPHDLAFPVQNTCTGTFTITLGLINHRAGWEASLSHNTLPALEPCERVTVTLTVTAPLGARLGTGEPIVDVEGYIEGRLIGGFRKLDRPPIPIHKPHEKGYAESEISIAPYPLQVGQDAWFSTVIQNTSGVTGTVDLEFGWARFGMGIPFTTTGISPSWRSVTLGPGLTDTVGVTWTPIYSGPHCVIVRLSDPDETYEPQQSQRNVYVEERPVCGETKTYAFTVYNDSDVTATVDIGLITFDVPGDWEVTTVPSDTLELGPYEEGTVTVIVKIPCTRALGASHTLGEIYALQAQAGSQPTIDVEGYIDGELVGGIEIQFAGEITRKVYLPIVLRN